MQAPARFVDRAPEQHIADSRKHLATHHRMPTRGGDGCLCNQCRRLLPGGSADISAAQQQGDHRWQAALAAHGEDQPGQQDQREQRTNRSDPVPGCTRIGKWPEKMRAVIGARIEQTMCGVAKGGGREYRAPVGTILLPRQPGRSGQQPADGDEREGMREMAVVFDGQQRVAGAADQDIGVRQHPAQRAQHPGLAPEPGTKRRLGHGRAKQGMCQGIHKFRRKGGSRGGRVFRVCRAGSTEKRGAAFQLRPDQAGDTLIAGFQPWPIWQ
jgi:hypothetical protein